MATSTVTDAPCIGPQARNSPPLERLTSFPVLLAALLAAALFVPLCDFTVEPDVWWHIKVGQDILRTHRLLTADTYSFTARGTPWIAGEWLGEALLAKVKQTWGFAGLLALNLILGTATLTGIYILALLRSRNSKAAFVACGLLLFLTAGFFTLRPQMLGYFFLVLTLIILERFRQGRWETLWLLPPVFLVWVNTHGSFVIGIFAVAVYGIAGFVEIRRGGLYSVPWSPSQRIRLGFVFLASLIALAITPYGTKLAAYPLDMAFLQPGVVANLQDWQPMPLNAPLGKLFLGLVVGFLLAQIVLRCSWHLAEFTLFLAGTVAACLHVRFLLLFVPFCAPLLAVILSYWIPPYQPRKDKHTLNALLMTAIAVGIIRFFPSTEHLKSRVAEHWPVKSVRYLKDHPPPQPMFNTYGYGGYMMYALDGQVKVFIDGRAEVYGHSGVLDDYLKIARLAPNALSLLTAYNVQSCLIGRDEPLATLLAASSQWQKIYADDMSVLFVRSQTGK